MTEPAPDEPPKSSARERRPAVPVRARMRDKTLWIILALVVVAVVAYFVAEDYFFDSFAFECFPRCTFKQKLSNYGQAVAFWGAILLALGAVARWVRLGRRPAAED